MMFGAVVAVIGFMGLIGIGGGQVAPGSSSSNVTLTSSRRSLPHQMPIFVSTVS
jgi:hypothetical protein